MGLKIGITGGIGAGKSMVCRIFKTLGIPVYDADEQAKLIMNHDQHIRQSLIDLFGQGVYNQDGQLNRNYLSAQVFGDFAKLKMLNDVVHPVVIEHAVQWAHKQTSSYSVKEAALLFESGSYTTLDKVILVSAPQQIRIDRVVKRDGVTEQQVRDRMSKQMPEEEKLKLADYVIINDGVQPLIRQVYDLHLQFLKEVNG